MSSLNNLTIDTGEVRLMVNDDPNRIIIFYPKDVDFVNHLFQLIEDLEREEKEYKAKDAELKAKQTFSSLGLPSNFAEQMELHKEVCTTMRGKIDTVFGAGTSQTAFGNANTIDMFLQFFHGVIPYIEQVRDASVNMYLDKDTGVLQ